jgi:hypothetical protein
VVTERSASVMIQSFFCIHDLITAQRYGFLCEQDAKNNVAKLADFYPNHRWEVERSEPTGGAEFTVSGYPY